jgi:hypothetical protein
LTYRSLFFSGDSSRVPGILVDLEVINGAPLSAIVVVPLLGMVYVLFVETVVFPSAVKVFSPVLLISPGFLDVSLSSRIPPLVTWRAFEGDVGTPP